MKSKNLIIFIPSIEGYGVEKNLFIIVNFLSKHFKKITLISVSKNYKSKLNKNIFFLAPKNTSWNNKSRFLKYFICSLLLINHLFSNRKSTVLSFQANLYATIISKIMGSNIIIRLNSAPVEWSKNIIKKYLFKCIFSIADKIIVNSLEFKKEIRKKFKIETICIYNPLNKDEILLKSKIKTKKIYSKNQSLKIINVGRLVDQKNQIIILEAVKLLSEASKINLELIIVGDGDLRQNYINYIKKNKLTKIIKIQKFSNNPFNLIKQADIFILSSKFEGLPNVLLESIVLGKFVISSNCKTGPKEILLNGKGGLLYKNNNTPALISKIIFYIKNKKKCCQMIVNAQKSLDRFDYDINCNKYLQIIKKFN